MHFQFSGIYLEDNQSGNKKMEESKMDKKPLIGVSVCAVVLLVLGSLTNVVGYQSVKSTVNDSPLFNVRTQRATNQQQYNIISKYLGKGMYALTFPLRDDKTEQLKKAIDFIGKMDDTTFTRFTELSIQKIRQDKSLKDTNPNDIEKTLKLMKTKSVTIINSFINRNNQNLTSSSLYTICHWFPGCIPLNIIMYLIAVIDILMVLYGITHPTTMWCNIP